MIGGQWVVSVVMTSELDIVRDCDETGTRGDGGASVWLSSAESQDESQDESRDESADLISDDDW